jgi:D-glycero-D-manno-heptose 1,7-bisphosphate phosphatase
MPSRPPHYVLLDRDGVINRRVQGGYVTRWEQFEFLPRALDALRLFAEKGYECLVISNQACVGRKLLTVAGLETITRRFMLEVALAGGNIRQVYYCMHLPEDLCSCRKPQPGMIHRARLDYGFVASETFFVGDSLEDLQAAASAGCHAVLVRRDAFLEKHNALTVTSNLYEAAETVIAQQTTGHGWLQVPSAMDASNHSFRGQQN